MKLYWLPLSPNNYTVTAVADYLELPLEKIAVDVMKGEQKTPEFLKMNPNGKCPTLADGDFYLWESNAILMYLCGKKAGGTDLWPADERTRIDISRWLIWQQAHWMRGCGTLLWERLVKTFFGGGTPNPEKEKEGEEAVRFHAGVLNQVLEGKNYLVNNQLTIADFAVAAPLPMAKAARLPLEDFPNIARWYQQIASLEAWRKNLPNIPQ
ncbi:MAG: glutathione S-transferase family protein [Deltaproteobacteria bacterium]|nr:glutathione S-transferase family protein [Deltaproteobacteria bacterium]